MITESSKNVQRHVSHEFLWIRRMCNCIWLNVHHCVLLLVVLGLVLGLGLDLVCGWLVVNIRDVEQAVSAWGQSQGHINEVEAVILGFEVETSCDEAVTGPRPSQKYNTEDIHKMEVSVRPMQFKCRLFHRTLVPQGFCPTRFGCIISPIYEHTLSTAVALPGTQTTRKYLNMK